MTERAVNRKRGIWLAIIGGTAVAVCWAVYLLVFGRPLGVGISLLVDIIAIVIGIFVAASRLR